VDPLSQPQSALRDAATRSNQVATMSEDGGMSPRPSPRVGVATVVAASTLLAALAGCSPAPPLADDPLPSSPSKSASPTPSGAPASPPAPTGGPRTPAGSPTPAAKAPARAPVRYAFPVDGNASYGRTHSLYPASDIFAACGAVARSPVDGVVLELSLVDRFVKAAPDGAHRGGLFVSIRGADNVRYYSAHLSQVGAGMAPGVTVRAGDPIGLVGKTGNANNVCHVHFALSPVCHGTGDWWHRRGVVFPWPYLDSWKAGGQRSPAAAIATWQRASGCASTAP